MDQDFTLWEHIILITIVTLVVGGILGGLYFWYEIAHIPQPALAPIASETVPQAAPPVTGLKAIQQAQENAEPATNTAPMLKTIQQTQNKAQATQPSSAAELEAIQEAQLKASEQSGGK